MKTKRSPRHLRIPRASCWPAWVVGLTASSRSSLRSRACPSEGWGRHGTGPGWRPLPSQGQALEIGTAATNGNGALKQLVKARSEAGVSGVDGVLGIAQQVGEA